MTNLRQNTILQRIPDIRLHVDSGNSAQVFTADKRIQCGPHGLAVLDIFSRPTSFADALSQLKARGVQDWKDLTSTIVQLYQAGVLQDKTQVGPTLTASASGYGAAPIHVAMLNDRVRTASFLAGIQEVVRPGDVVVDIGTGTGILAIGAARAGAGHVYAIEASSISGVASAVFQTSGLADRITIIHGWSTQISLPQRADVLVSEMIGNDPLGEQVLEITVDALKRLVKPEARLVPSQVKVFGLPVTLPEDELMKRAVTDETLRNWKSWYGIDFSPLADMTRASSQPLFSVRPQSARDWQTLSEPVLLAKVDFKAFEHLVVDNTITVTAKAAGQLNGLLIYFRLVLGPTTRLSTHPAQAHADNHWRSPVWYVVDALSLQPGDQFSVNYQYGLHGSGSIVRVSQHA